MAWVMRYSATIQWVGPNGLGMNGAAGLQGVVGPPNGQRLVFFNTSAPGSNTFTSSDISTFCSTMQTDISNQLTANLTRISNFSSGGG